MSVAIKRMARIESEGKSAVQVTYPGAREHLKIDNCTDNFAGCGNIQIRLGASKTSGAVAFFLWSRGTSKSDPGPLEACSAIIIGHNTSGGLCSSQVLPKNLKSNDQSYT